MSYAVSKKPAAPLLDVLMSSRHNNTLHLVAASGLVLCRCSLMPESAILVREVAVTPYAATFFCEESLIAYRDVKETQQDG